MALRSKPRTRRRKTQLALQPEDFDDVRYKVELVRVAGGEDCEESALPGLDAVEVGVAAGVALALLGGCAALGASLDLLELAHEDLRLLLPMLALPLAWLLALHAYERQVAARPLPVSSSAASPPKVATT